jgi:dephospho-CoA kinase
VLLVALTGGIATGKSVIAEVLRQKGCYLDSSDAAAHELMGTGRPAWKKIFSHFGPEILNPDRTINRKAMGEIVFSNREERLFLNRLIHPLVLRHKKRTVRKLEKEGRTRIFVSEAALTIEAGFTGFFDKIIIASCPKKIQLRRLMDRDGISRTEAARRIGSQLPLREKLKHADYVIDTSGTIMETVDQTASVYAQLIRDFELKTMLRREAGS